MNDRYLSGPHRDGFYDELVALHEGLSDEESALLNWRLVLILAASVNDEEQVRSAMNVARFTG